MIGRIRWRRAALWLAAAPVVAGMTLWGVGAIYYSPIPGGAFRAALAIAFAAGTAFAFLALPRRGRTLLGFAVVFAALVLAWRQIPASNDRDWQPEVAVTPWAELAGDRVTIHGVRNFEYRTETDYTPRWEDRTYDLRELDSTDLVAVYWGSPAVAHIMLSFGFAGREYLTASIETRKERRESYSTIAGFFRQYELVYVVGDERDVIGVRTTHRRPQEDVYVYRVHLPRQENIRPIFLDYLARMNDLRSHPRHYNTLTTNCTTGVLLHSRVNPESPPWSWKILLSGYLPEYAYGLGRLDGSLPFEELRRRAWVNERAHAAGRDPAFSQRIREGLSLPAAASRPS